MQQKQEGIGKKRSEGGEGGENKNGQK